MTKKTNNSTGFTGIITSMASFNAEVGDNAGSRATNKGMFYATHYKMKWLIRNYYTRINGHKSVLVKGRRYTDDKGQLGVQTLEERLQDVFEVDNKALKKIPTNELLKMVVDKQDVKNFGIALALTAQNSKVTGVSQLSYAKNIYEDTEEQDIQINGAYATSSDKNGNNTLGRRKFLDYANYVYNFTVQPSNLDEDFTGIDGLEYTQDDYNWFKKGMLKAVSDNQSASSSSFTAYGMFIDLKDGEDLIQSNFDDYISCTDSEDEMIRNKKVVDFTLLANYYEQIKDSVEYSELYVVKNIAIDFKGLEELEKLGVVIKNMSEARKI